MTFGERLVSLRESRDISRKDLAAYLDIPYTTLRNYEKDEREAGHVFLCRVADFFGVTVDYLLGTKEKAPASMQELSRELTLLIKWFSRASAHDQASILRFAELAAAANQQSEDLSPEERARAVLRKMAMQDSLSAGEDQVL